MPSLQESANTAKFEQPQTTKSEDTELDGVPSSLAKLADF